MAGRGKRLRRLEEMSLNRSSDQEGTSIKLLAKFSYKANPSQPGGFEEVDIKQGENVWLVKKGHLHNALWWEIEREDGKRGYAPAQYLMELETKVTSLPWLNEKQEPDNVPLNGRSDLPKFKPYMSAYGSSKPENEETYYCKTCERGFNGPIPFRAHVNSKGHKEELEIARRYGRGE